MAGKDAIKPPVAGKDAVGHWLVVARAGRLGVFSSLTRGSQSV